MRDQRRAMVFVITFSDDNFGAIFFNVQYRHSTCGVEIANADYNTKKIVFKMLLMFPLKRGLTQISRIAFVCSIQRLILTIIRLSGR